MADLDGCVASRSRNPNVVRKRSFPNCCLAAKAENAYRDARVDDMKGRSDQLIEDVANEPIKNSRPPKATSPSMAKRETS